MIYRNTPIVGNNYRDILKKPIIDPSLDDEEYIITPEFEYRPDKLAVHYYDDEKLWFVFQLRNMDKLKDPIFDFKRGVKIMLPTKRNIDNMRFE